VDLTQLILGLFGLGNQNQVNLSGLNPNIDPNNQIVALQNRYAQLGIPNSTMLTQDIGGAMNAAQQGSFQNQLALAQLAMQANQQQQAQDATQGTAAGGQPGAPPLSGTFDQPTTSSGGSTSGGGVPPSGVLTG
jgi:hypothetical protein